MGTSISEALVKSIKLRKAPMTTATLDHKTHRIAVLNYSSRSKCQLKDREALGKKTNHL